MDTTAAPDMGDYLIAHMKDALGALSAENVLLKAQLAQLQAQADATAPPPEVGSA